MASKNVVLKDTFGNQIFPATTAEQVSYDATKNMKQALDAANTHASVANLAADMTDETKIYVYTGSEEGYEFGHWYYYDGSAWTDGGEYMSGETDTTLSVAGTPADAKATGDKITQLKDTITPFFPANEITKIYKTGYYYDAALSLVENASSVYTDAIDCKGYTSVVVCTANNIAANNARYMGFKKNGEIYAVYRLTSIAGGMCKQVGDHYETTFNVREADTFYMSIQSSNPPTEIRLEPTISTRIKESVFRQTVYVAQDGDDANDGATRETPFATIQKAVDSGAKYILVKEGTYAPFAMLEKNGITIALDEYYSKFVAGSDDDNPKIVIDGNNTKLTGVSINRCVDCKISDIEVKNCTSIGFRIVRCTNDKFVDCCAHDIGVDRQQTSIAGFLIQYTDADFETCVAYNIATTVSGAGAGHYDGFNIHYTGTTHFYNCSAWNCEDDGISHHDACCGLIDGGEWYNCGKGGVASPTHGAKINVQNVYSHNNGYGLYADNTSAVTTNRGNIIIANSVFKNNSIKDVLVGGYYAVKAINCIYDTVEGNNIERFGVN